MKNAPLPAVLTTILLGQLVFCCASWLVAQRDSNLRSQPVTTPAATPLETVSPLIDELPPFIPPYLLE